MEKVITYTQKDKVVSILMAIFFFLVCGVFTPLSLHYRGATFLIHTWFIIVILGILLPIFSVLSTFRLKIIITSKSITTISLFKTRQLDLRQVKGFKYVHGGDAVVLTHINNSKFDIGFGKKVLSLGGLKEWITESFDDITGMDQELRAIQENQLLDKQELEQNLTKANKQIWIFSGIFVLCSFFFFFYKQESLLIVILSLFLPFVGLYIIYVNKGFIRLHFSSIRKTNPLYTISFCSLMAGIVVYTRHYDIVDYSLVLFPTIPFTMFFLLTSAIVLRRNLILGVKKGKVEEFVIVLIFAITYGYASVININVTFDQSKPFKMEKRVLNKKGYEGNRTITIAIGGNQGKIQVTKGLFEKISIGDKIWVYQKQGFLDIPWVLKIEKKRPATSNK